MDLRQSPRSEVLTAALLALGGGALYIIWVGAWGALIYLGMAALFLCSILLLWVTVRRRIHERAAGLALTYWMGTAICVWLGSAFGYFAEGATISGAPVSFGDALYVSIGVMTTIGFGDYQPQPGLQRVLVCAEAISGYVVLGTATALVFKCFEQKED